MSGKGVGSLLGGVRVSFGDVCHFFVNLTLYLVGVLWIRLVVKCMLYSSDMLCVSLFIVC